MIILQPVLDFLLWHHLGPNYEERAHDLLQVTAFNHENKNVCSSKCIILPGLQAVFLQLCKWDEPRSPGRTIYLEDRDPADQVLKRALSPLIYFLFVIGWNLGDCCSLSYFSSSSPNSHRKAGRRSKVVRRNLGFKADGSVPFTWNLSWAWRMARHSSRVAQIFRLNWPRLGNSSLTVMYKQHIFIAQRHHREEHFDPSRSEPGRHLLSVHRGECQLQRAAHTKVASQNAAICQLTSPFQQNQLDKNPRSSYGSWGTTGKGAWHFLS